MNRSFSKALFTCLLWLVLGVASVTLAQDATPIELTGSIEAVDGQFITVNGLTLDISGLDAALVEQLTPGAVISSSGTLSNGLITALVVVIINPAPETEETSEEALINGFQVSFSGREYDGITTRFSYLVAGTGIAPDLSHFNVGLPQCSPGLEISGFSPESAVSFGVDPTTGVSGIKWDVPLLVTDTRNYSISFVGNVPLGSVIVAVKGGPGFESFILPGPACDEAALHVVKYVSVDAGQTWADANSAPGPEVALEESVSFRFVVSNTGSQALSNLSLTDSVFPTESCSIPSLLEADQSFECVIGPFAVVEGQHSNIATVSANADGQSLSATDSAHYFGGELDEDEQAEGPVTIIIEGPVQAININVITIFGINITLDSNDPTLAQIRIGDVVRIEGDTLMDGNTIIIVAVNVVIINVDADIIIDNGSGQVRNSNQGGNCQGGPPAWAPAHGWRARCEGGGRR